MIEAMCSVFEESNSRTRLMELGLTLEMLGEVVREGYAYRQEATANHPPTHGGTNAYGNMVRALRDALMPLGWKRSNEHNFCVTFHPKTNVAVVVSAGNEITGLAHESANTRRGKGRRTVLAIEENLRQLDLFSALGVEFRGNLQPQSDTAYLPSSAYRKTYYLLNFVDQIREELRSELSLLIAVDEQGKITRWAERIILPVVDLNDDFAISNLPAPSAPEPEVRIKRRG